MSRWCDEDFLLATKGNVDSEVHTFTANGQEVGDSFKPHPARTFEDDDEHDDGPPPIQCPHCSFPVFYGDGGAWRCPHCKAKGTMRRADGVG